MKKHILTSFILLLFTVSIHAAPISVGTIDNINVANILFSSSSNTDCASITTSANCDFINADGTLLTDAALAPIVTSDPATYVIPSVADNNASFDLGFDGFNVYNGAGDDLVIFIVGNGSTFGLDVFDENNILINSSIFDVTVADTVYDVDGNWLCVGGTDALCTDGYPLSAVFVDFGDSLAGNIALGNIHLSLGNSAFSLAGGFYTSPTVVPLPLSVVLFSSGLALLGLTGRRKKS